MSRVRSALPVCEHTPRVVARELPWRRRCSQPPAPARSRPLRVPTSGAERQAPQLAPEWAVSSHAIQTRPSPWPSPKVHLTRRHLNQWPEQAQQTWPFANHFASEQCGDSDDRPALSKRTSTLPELENSRLRNSATVTVARAATSSNLNPRAHSPLFFATTGTSGRFRGASPRLAPPTTSNAQAQPLGAASREP